MSMIRTEGWWVRFINSRVSTNLGWSKFLKGGILAERKFGRNKTVEIRTPPIRKYDLGFPMRTPLLPPGSKQEMDRHVDPKIFEISRHPRPPPSKRGGDYSGNCRYFWLKFKFTIAMIAAFSPMSFDKVQGKTEPISSRKNPPPWHSERAVSSVLADNKN